MSKLANKSRVTLSVLDRLLDFEPRSSNEAAGSGTESVVELKRSVLRDLEWLLNTRVGYTISDSLEETKRSVICYGLPDFTGTDATNHTEMKELRKSIENTLSFFEPRFLNMKITFEPITSRDKQLRFRIEALLNIDPTPEMISFDSVLSSGNGQFLVMQR